jgi:hypothetical protein
MHRPSGSSGLRRSVYASLRVVEVLTNLSNHEDEKKSKVGSAFLLLVRVLIKTPPARQSFSKEFSKLKKRES